MNCAFSAADALLEFLLREEKQPCPDNHRPGPKDDNEATPTREGRSQWSKALNRADDQESEGPQHARQYGGRPGPISAPVVETAVEWTEDRIGGEVETAASANT